MHIEKDNEAICKMLQTLDPINAISVLEIMISQYNDEADKLGVEGITPLCYVEKKKIENVCTGSSENKLEDLQKTWNDTSKTGSLSPETRDFLRRVQARADKFDDKETKEDLNNRIQELKTKEENFHKDNKILNNFVNQHYDRAKDAANFLDRLDDVNDKINYYTERVKEAGSSDEKKLYKQKLSQAKSQKKAILEEDKHHFVEKNKKKYNSNIFGSIFITALTIVAAAVGAVVAAVVGAAAVGGAIVGGAIALLVSTLSVYAYNRIRGINTIIFLGKENTLKQLAQAQLDKSNKVLGVAVGKEVVRVKGTDSKEESKVFDGVKYTETKDIKKANGLKLATLDSDSISECENNFIKSQKLKELSKGGKLERTGKFGALYEYTQDHLKETNETKKYLLKSLIGLSANPTDNLYKPMPKASTKNGHLNNEL